MKKVLITGISGFVGGYLGELLLSKGFEVHGTYHGNINRVLPGLQFHLHEMDITDELSVRNIYQDLNPELVFHLAAQSSAALSWQQPGLTMDINVRGTVNLLEAIRKSSHDTKVMLIGSSEEYGKIEPQNPVVHENYCLNPVNPYGISKVTQNRIGASYAQAYNMNIVMTRAFNHIGPRQSETFAISSFAKQIAQIEKGLCPPVIMVGNLDASRDFTDVRDVVRAYYLLSFSGKSGETYNVGSGVSYSIHETLKILLDMSKQKINIEIDQSKLRPTDTPLIICANDKLVAVTGWKPAFTLQETLRQVIDYWRENI